MSGRAILTAALLYSASATLIGCTGSAVAPAIDLAEIKSPEIRKAVLAELKSRPAAPDVPLTKKETRDWIDRLRADIEQKAAAGWELVENVKQCRAPIEKLAASR